MRYHDHKLLMRQAFQDLHDLLSGLTVQITGRLVCHDNVRILGKCSCNGKTLLLPTGKL